MNILDIKIMRGPNYWSIRRHKLIVMRLDLGNLEQHPTNKIPGFLERLSQAMPSLYEHRCSEGCAGGFFKRIKEGTWMGHVVEHVALELQTLAGMDTGFGRTRSTSSPGIYNVVYSYIEENAGVYAGKTAVILCDALARGEEYDYSADIQRMRELREKERLGPSTGGLVEEAAKRGIPFMRLNKYSLVQLGYGINQQRIQATVAGTTSNIGVEIACDKEETKDLLDKMNISVPKGFIVYDEEDLKDAVDRLGYPLVLKPVDGNHGRGSTLGVNDWETALRGLARAKEISRRVICERFVEGYDYRLLVINYRFVAAAKRTPAVVVGNGKHNIQELIDIVNTDPRRGYGHEKVLTSIKVDAETMRLLEKKGYTLETILPAGEEMLLKRTANLSTGGTAEDVTDTVHPYNVFTAERIARIIGLDICGIDIMSPDLSVPMPENKGCVLEVNAAPGFRMHLSPTSGLPRNVAEPVIDMLFPPGKSARIPIIAVTGTNGKTTTTRLIAHLMKTNGHKVGFTTSDGIYIQNRLLEKGDCTGPTSARFVLMDPTVDIAVLECARGGLLRSGLGFDNCDIGIVTNVTTDHLGLNDIDTLGELARVKSVIPEAVFPNGYAILNADDDLVYKMTDSLTCKIAFFSMDENNKHLKDHCNDGGLAVVAENGFVTILKGNWKIRVEKIINIPLTYSGKALFMVQNVLPAVLASFIRGMKIEDIRLGLQTFMPSPAQTPGRLNWFQFKNFDILVDFAHNPAGMRALTSFVKKLDAPRKVGIVVAAGDRRDEDIVELGRIAGETFDEIYVHHGKHLRGRTKDSMLNLLLDGIKATAASKPCYVTETEREAIDRAVGSNLPKETLIVICSDVVTEALESVQHYKEAEQQINISRKDIPNL